MSDGLLGGLVTDLAASPTGIDFVYRALDEVVERYGLHDAVAVVDDPTIGRQVFRAGRRPLDQERVLGDPMAVAPGLYADPQWKVDAVGEAIINLCEVALQLDLRRHDASHDGLTGLYNRRSFDELLDQATSRSARYGWPFVLALVDLDRFKALNDELGHSAGDQVLRRIGAELRSSLRGGDAAARVGGDEFALILDNGSAGVVASLIDRLEVAVAADAGVEVGFSAGVALAPAEAADRVSLYRLADHRLYEAKHGSKRARPAPEATSRARPAPEATSRAPGGLGASDRVGDRP